MRFVLDVLRGAALCYKYFALIALHHVSITAFAQYDVDMDIGHCYCSVGKTGGPCKHQAAVVKHFNISSTNFIPVNDPQTRLLLYKIATGK